MNEFIYYEDKDLYDGWICMFRPSDQKIIWRDYVVNKIGLTQEKKKEIENKLKSELK